GRTALLANGFAESDLVRTFTYLTLEDLEQFQPESLAGPVAKLRTLAESVLDGTIKFGSLRHAIVAFTGLKHGCLKPEDRDLFWRAFEVPGFEQFRGFAHELLAWECEAHEGLHIQTDNAIFETHGHELVLSCLDCAEYSLLRLATEISGQIEAEPCGCGHASPRLVDVQDHRVPQKAMAAFA